MNRSIGNDVVQNQRSTGTSPAGAGADQGVLATEVQNQRSTGTSPAGAWLPRGRTIVSLTAARCIRSTAGLLLTGGMLLYAAGCGGGDGPSVEVAPVTGTVRYNGVLIQGALVQFTQEGGPVVAGGFTDDAGEFELTSYRQGDGAPVGENQVAISLPAGAADDSEEHEAKKEEAMAIADPLERRTKLSEISRGRKNRTPAEKGSLVKPRNQIPKRYASAATSKLSFPVEAGTQNVCEFDLTD